MKLSTARTVHIMGIGGAGMSSLAWLLLDAGLEVSGCDSQTSAATDELSAAGVSISVGHGAHGVADVLCYSPAISASHEEIRGAAERGTTVLTRAALFAEIGEWRPIIGLTGTHGKTTATSMMVHVMAAATRDCGRLLGADVVGVGRGGAFGAELVVEVDESYGTFSALRPAALGILNVEADHLDFYGTVAALESAFADVAERTEGPVVVWSDDPGATRVAPDAITVGTSGLWRVRNVSLSRDGASWRLEGPSESLEITTRVTGHHIVADASVVAVLARSLGVDAGAIIQGLATFSGAPRRFQRRGRLGSCDVYEDYAHLPSEVAATLRAAQDAGYERVLAVFQPHRVTRTAALATSFGSSFEDAAYVVITDIYTAGEPNPHGLTGQVIVDALASSHAAAIYVGSFDEIRSLVSEKAPQFDAIFFLGAGDVASVIDSLGVTP